MRKMLLKTAIFVLMFGLGVGVAIGWQLYQWSLVPYEVSPIPPWPLAPAQSAHVSKMDEIWIVREIDTSGPEADGRTMELSDGTRITRSCESFASQSVLARVLETRLLNVRIAERSAALDGEEILITSPRVMRFSIYKENLCVTEAPSLKHLRFYESGALRNTPKIAGNE